MVLRAIVDKIIDDSHVRIRIPDYNKFQTSVGATPSSELPVAISCSTPGLATHYKRGDIVIVGFERDDFGAPVILGALSSARENRAVTEAKFSSMRVNVDANLPLDTIVQGAGKEFWPYLHGLTENVQIKLNELQAKIESLEFMDTTLRYPYAENAEF